VTRTLAAVLLAACGGKLPSALSPDAPTETAPTVVEVHDLAAATTALVGDDPLLRRPRVTADWGALDGGAPITAWAALNSTTGTTAPDWFALERGHPGSLGVPLARGARLATLESMVAGDLLPDAQVPVAGWLAPLSDLDRQGPSDILPPLSWLVPGGAAAIGVPDPALPAAILHSAERQVLLGWLDGPDLDVRAPAAAMVPGIHDRLVDSPAGTLLVARAQGVLDASLASSGLDDLRVATTLALTDAAADRDSEQAAATAALAADAATLSAAGAVLSDGRDAALRLRLRRARERLTADAGTDRSVGLALVALAAERLLDTCPDRPCRGLDRVESLDTPTRWTDDAAPLAAIWRVVAAKHVLDTVEVTAERPTWHAGTPDLVDLLLGTGAQQVDISLLRQPSPRPETWLALTRAAGTADATDADSGKRALRHLLVDLCDAALATPLPGEQRALVQRIRSRAEQPPQPAPQPPPLPEGP